jgi:hypothetical protein
MPRATPNRQSLPQIAKAIKTIEKKKLISGAIEIGKLLCEASEQCEHGEYMDWIKAEFGWSHSTSLNYRNVYALSQNRNSCDFDKLDISLSALYAVARLLRDDSSAHPQTVGNAILEAAKHGRVSFKTVLAMANAADEQAEAALEAAATESEPNEDSPESEADAESNDNEAESPYGLTEFDHQTLKLSHLQSLLDTPADDWLWPALVKHVGPVKVREFISKLQAACDKHCEDNAVKAAADRAERLN